MNMIPVLADLKKQRELHYIPMIDRYISVKATKQIKIIQRLHNVILGYSLGHQLD